MTVAGYVKAITSKKKVYFYVMHSFRDENKKPQNKTIFALGRKHNALLLLHEWINKPGEVPAELKGYVTEDFKEWLRYVEEKQG